MNLPKKNGESVINPPFNEWRALLKKNRALFDQYRFLVSGAPFHKLRQGVRERLKIFPIDPDLPLLLTGHQPHFIHPGIWFRFFLLARALEELKVQPAAFVLDSDLNYGLSAPVPVKFEGQFFRKEVPLELEGKAFEFLPAPGKGEWDKFLAQIESHLNFPEAEIARNNFSRIREFPLAQESFPWFYSRLHRFWEKDPEYPEFLLSAILGKEFELFFLHIARDSRNFAYIYNQALQNWRIKRRTRAQNVPFPDLSASSDQVELPFWCVIDEKRLPIFLDSSGKCRADGQVLGRPEEVASAYLIRPRAATLTMFLRLFVCDLFLHGLGGADYEDAVDSIISNFFSVEPPHYVSAALTLYFPGFDPQKRAGLENELKIIKKSPESFLPEEKLSQCRHLISRKLQLKGQKLSKEGYLELQKINSLLLNQLEGETLRLEKEIQLLEEAEEALAFRKYPFFFFDPQLMLQLAFQA